MAGEGPEREREARRPHWTRTGRLGPARCDVNTAKFLRAARKRPLENYLDSHPDAPPAKVKELEREGWEHQLIYEVLIYEVLIYEVLIYEVLIYCGLRIDECRRIRWCDFEHRNGKVFVVPKNTKTGEEDATRVEPWLWANLQEWRAVEEQRQRRKIQNNELVFQVRTGSSVRRRFLKDLKHAEIPREDAQGRVLDIHSFRYTCAVIYFLKTRDPKMVQKILRHKTLAMTMDIYANLGLDDYDDADELVPDPCAVGTPCPKNAPKVWGNGTVADPSRPDRVAKEVS
ncbi:MAG: tyrosine-type recombinase/integrase [Planctomycetota bacterium]